MSSSTARTIKNTAFKPPRPSTSTTATRAPRRPSPTLSSSPEPVSTTEPRTQRDDDPVGEEEPPLIPPKLLTRLIQHHFEDSDTRLGKDAGELISKYMEIFLREAFARAVHEKDKARQGARVTGISADFLEVEDLEKAAPQLMLDF
jgi:hypothetical protein